MQFSRRAVLGAGAAGAAVLTGCASDGATTAVGGADPTARLHLYGKRDVRTGRKMGHVTKLKSS